MKIVTVMGILLTASMPGEAWAMPSPEDTIVGKATYYRPGLMDQVAINRGLDLDGYLAGVALNRAGDLGRVVWLDFDDGLLYGPFLVVDCAQRGEHFRRREAQGYVVEVPAWVARLHGFYGVGPVPVTVRFVDPYLAGKVLDMERAGYRRCLSWLNTPRDLIVPAREYSISQNVALVPLEFAEWRKDV